MTSNLKVNKPRIRLAKPSYLGLDYGKTWLCYLPGPKGRFKGRLGLGDTPKEAYECWRVINKAQWSYVL